MATVTLNPGARAEVFALFEAGVHTYGQRLVQAAQERADKLTGLMAESIKAEPVEHNGNYIQVTVHDGPGADGKTYGAAEEVMRGGSHMFLRPALDATWGDFSNDVAHQFDGASGSASYGPALPGAKGSWTPRPGGKSYPANQGG